MTQKIIGLKMSLQTETVTSNNPASKVIKYMIFIIIAFIGLFLYGYTKPVKFEEVYQEVSL